MKHEQVVVDYWMMIKTSLTCLLLAFSGFVFLKMIQTIFWLPQHLKLSQQRLEDLVNKYSEETNKMGDEGLTNPSNKTDNSTEDLSKTTEHEEQKKVN